MVYRLYQPRDFAPLYAIEEVCFQPPLRFPRTYMRELVNSPRAATWIAEEENTMAAFAIVEWQPSDGQVLAYVSTLEVSPEFRRRGIGEELLRRLQTSARNAGAGLIWLHVDAENAAAVRLYEAAGFNCQGREEHFYARHRPALVYSRPLGPS